MPCDDNYELPMKIGDTVRLSCIFKNSDDAPASLEGYRIDVDFIHPRNGSIVKSTNSVRADGGIIIHEGEEEDGIPGTNIGEYTIHAGNSAEWPLGKMPVDIMYSKNGDVIHTQDFFLNFKQGRSKILHDI